MDELKDVAKSLRRLPVVEPHLPTVRACLGLLGLLLLLVRRLAAVYGAAQPAAMFGQLALCACLE